MKKIVHVLFILTSALSATGQAKLISQSTHYYDTLTASFYAHDSMKHFFKPANTTTSIQHIDDGYVEQKVDSVWQYGWNGTAMYRQARWYNNFNPSYSANLLYIDTINDVNGVNIYSYKTEYFHNGTNYDSSVSWQTVFSNSTTTLTDKGYYHQNAQNMIDTFWSIYFTAGAYSSSYKQASIYNANNDIATSYSYQSADSINYTPTSKTEYYYSAGNLLDSMVFYSFNASNWYKTAVKTYTYNGTNARTKTELYNVSIATQVYTNSVRDEYLRINGTVLDTIYSQLWNSGFSKYDTTVKRGLVINNGLMRKSYSYNYDVLGSKWIFDPYGALRNFYYDVELNVSNSTFKQNSLTLYPNPSANMLHINPPQPGAKYSVLSMDGKLMIAGFMDEKNGIEISHLAKGAYYLILDTDNSTSSQVFVKRD